MLRPAWGWGSSIRNGALHTERVLNLSGYAKVSIDLQQLERDGGAQWLSDLGRSRVGVRPLLGTHTYTKQCPQTYAYSHSGTHTPNTHIVAAAECKQPKASLAARAQGSFSSRSTIQPSALQTRLPHGVRAKTPGLQ